MVKHEDQRPHTRPIRPLNPALTQSSQVGAEEDAAPAAAAPAARETNAEMAKRLAEEEAKQIERAQEAGAGGIMQVRIRAAGSRMRFVPFPTNTTRANTTRVGQSRRQSGGVRQVLRCDGQGHRRH